MHVSFSKPACKVLPTVDMPLENGNEPFTSTASGAADVGASHGIVDGHALLMDYAAALLLAHDRDARSAAASLFAPTSYRMWGVRTCVVT